MLGFVGFNIRGVSQKWFRERGHAHPGDGGIHSAGPAWHEGRGSREYGVSVRRSKIATVAEWITSRLFAFLGFIVEE